MCMSKVVCAALLLVSSRPVPLHSHRDLCNISAPLTLLQTSTNSSHPSPRTPILPRPSFASGPKYGTGRRPITRAAHSGELAARVIGPMCPGSGTCAEKNKYMGRGTCK